MKTYSEILRENFPEKKYKEAISILTGNEFLGDTITPRTVKEELKKYKLNKKTSKALLDSLKKVSSSLIKNLKGRGIY